MYSMTPINLPIRCKQLRIASYMPTHIYSGVRLYGLGALALLWATSLLQLFQASLRLHGVVLCALLVRQLS